ncbi:hypothetical protein [Algibacillus agarilyticus]|uniref:hypothetical protein n=1 Tax=Algibacillus agarilyticus TaxID=2234133 RepID=UPI000DCF8BBA|nr:hypothetical protein [Algibacillus agarilyticus]
MSRIEYRKQVDQLEVIIKPINEGKFQTYFLAFWLIGWAFGWVAAFNMLLSESISPGYLFVVVWIVGWTFGGAFAGLWLAWKAAGFEQVIVDKTQLSIKHNIFGYGPQKVHQVSSCNNLRAAGYFGNDKDISILNQIGMKGGVIAVDIPNEVVRFGVSLEEGEALEVVESLRKYIKTPC